MIGLPDFSYRMDDDIWVEMYEKTFLTNRTSEKERIILGRLGEIG